MRQKQQQNTLVFALIMCACAKAVIIEYEKYPLANGMHALAADAKIDDQGLRAVACVFEFDNVTISEAMILSTAKEVPVYFTYEGYMLPAKQQQEGSPYKCTISFAEFAALNSNGAYIRQNYVGTGKWPEQQNADVIAEVHNADAAQIGFETSNFAMNVEIDGKVDKHQVQFSHASPLHILPASWQNKDIKLFSSTNKKYAIDTTKTQYFVGNENVVILSMTLLDFQHWQNATTIRIGIGPHHTNLLQNMVTVAYLVVSLAVLIGMSTKTTQGMLGAPENREVFTAFNFSEIENTVFSDVTVGAGCILAYNVIVYSHIVDARQFGTTNSYPSATKILACVFLASTLSVSTLVRWRTYKYTESSHTDAKLWPLARCSSETLIIVALSCAIPSNIGMEYAFLMMFSAAIVVPAILGRDIYFVVASILHRASWKTKTDVGIVTAASLIFCSAILIVSNSLLRVIMHRSESFPSSDELFLQLASCIICLIIALVAVTLGPLPQAFPQNRDKFAAAKIVSASAVHM